MIVVLMGVAGAGKTTVGRLAAERLGWPFHDADDYHDEAARLRMSRGEALTDLERGPWLERLAALVREIAGAGGSAVLACSALRAAYRDRLAEAAGRGGMVLVYLRLPPAEAARRTTVRHGHFARAELVPSQFAALEEPDAADAVVLDATRPIGELAIAVASAATGAAGPA